MTTNYPIAGPFSTGVQCDLGAMDGLNLIFFEYHICRLGSPNGAVCIITMAKYDLALPSRDYYELDMCKCLPFSKFIPTSCEILLLDIIDFVTVGFLVHALCDAVRSGHMF